MLILLIILIPLLGGLLTLAMPSSKANITGLLSSIATLVIAIVAAYLFTQKNSAALLTYDCNWIASIGARFTIDLGTGLSVLMVLLTALAFPLIFIFLQNKRPEQGNLFYGLMLLAQVGLTGVFVAKDALLFYGFWEIALIPVYFLSSMYGGANRIKVTFKFFVYTFAGSLLMLVSILYIYQQTPTHSFAWGSFVETGNNLSPMIQNWLFWLMFIAFAIKMPVFPFHTWQPDAYEQSATPVTIVMSALMVKMGLFAVIIWLVPVLAAGSLQWINVVMVLSVCGIVYASCLAMVQSNIKRLIAYSSIAHVGLMCAAIFSQHELGTQGAILQMFNHGINIMGLWFLVAVIENRLHTQDMNQMGGIAKVAPVFTIALVLISLANIALPLTNGFVGEFMMFNAVFNSATPYRVVFTVVAGLGIILAAVYTLTMIRKVAFGELNAQTEGFKDLSHNETFILALIMLLILVLGFYPKLITGLIAVS
ncbi:MAG: NADH-quinone oxidoreductase subunit M [Chitinophagaceae bacterium]|nr:NADH-quinone oxidoreductase subunit M [Chitinophagaceae bacterium]